MESKKNVSKTKVNNSLISLNYLIIWSLVAMLVLIIAGVISWYFLNIYIDKIDLSRLSNLSIVLNTLFGLPFVIVGTVLAFFLALTAYNLSKADSHRDDNALFHAKYGEASRLFTTISIRLGRLISLSDSSLLPFKKLHTASYDSEYLNATQDVPINLDSYYSEFYQTIKSDLQRLGFIPELKALEEDFTKLLADPVASHLFSSKLKEYFSSDIISSKNYSLSDIISSIRGWGCIIASSPSNNTSTQLGKDLFSHLNTKSLVTLFNFSDKPQNKGEESYLAEKEVSGDTLINSDSLALVFFSSLLDSRKIITKDLEEDDLLKLVNLEIPLSREQLIPLAKSEVLTTRVRKKFEKIDGIVLLAAILDSIPNNEELAGSYGEAIGLDEDKWSTQVTVGTDPSTILEKEKYQLKIVLNNIQQQEQKDRLRFLDIESDFIPVNFHRYIFN